MTDIQQDDVRQFVFGTVSASMNLPVDETTVTDQSPLGLGGIDLESLQLIELASRLETQYEIKIPDADIEPLSAMTLGELIEYVQKKAAE